MKSLVFLVLFLFIVCNEKFLFEYDAIGNVIRESDGLVGSEKRGTDYTYDHLGRMIAEADALGNAMLYTYDKAGNLISKTDKNQVTTTYTYDGTGNLLTEENDKDSSLIFYHYDFLGRKTKAQDTTGEYLFSYDSFSQLIQIRNPLEITQKYAYDKLGRVTSYLEEQSGIKNQSLQYEYDSSGRLTNLYTDIANINYAYDADGKLISEVNSTTNELTQYSHDMLSNPTEKNIWQGDTLQSSQKYQYDLLGRKTETMIDDIATLYFYDGLGRLEQSVEGSPDIENEYSKGKITSYN